MSRTSHEQYISPDAPSVKDIERVRAHLLLFAQRHDMLIRRDKRDTAGSLRYMVRPSVRYERPDILNILNTNGSSFGFLYRKTLGALAAYDVNGEERLRIVQSSYTSHFGRSMGGVKSSYMFNWQGDNVTQSRRTVEITPVPDQADMYDLIDHFAIEEDEAAILDARIDIEQVTAEDVEFLFNDMRNLASEVDDGERVYSEDQKKYMDYFAS